MGGGATAKKLEAIFGGDGNALGLDCGGLEQYTESGYILLYVNWTLI